VSSATTVEGIGTVRWKVIDLYGAVHTLKTKAYYVPTVHIRLCSPQAHFCELSEGSLDLNSDTLTLRFPDKVKLVFPINLANQLLFLDDHRGPHVGFSSEDSELFDNSRYVLTSVADEVNQNLDGPQRELLLWHHKLGHINFDWVQALLKHERRNPNACKILEAKFSSIGHCRSPLCTACQLGKGKRQSTNAERFIDVQTMKLKEGTIQPGDCLHLDQYKSAVLGHLPHTMGREKSSLKYSGGLIAVDASSGKVFIRHQVSLTSGETIQAMCSIVQDARENGICICSVHTDNAPFNASEFHNYIAHELSATQTFSSVGAHHQAGIAERAIGMITSWARTMMLHSIIHWPDSANLELWPFAMDHAVYQWNSLPRKDTFLSPNKLYTSV
jgi:GAG-pre-integrase domain